MKTQESQETNKLENKPRIGITLGDFNGIGPEVVLKTLSDKRINRICTPVIYGSSKVIAKYKRHLNIDFTYHQLGHNQNKLDLNSVNLISCWNENPPIEFGKGNKKTGECAFAMLKESSKDLHSNFIDAIVTAPISKYNIQEAGFDFPGHTEYYTEQFSDKDSLMFLVSDALKIGVVTGHIPILDVPKALTKAKITEKLNILIDTLKKDFAIKKPRIAVLGLNPHAGENGVLGKEEEKIINPVVLDFKNKGHLVYGSFPADGFFGMMQYKKFDAVLAMYHDQGLIPFKHMAFDKGINYTAGLPIIRTSPDHGTGFDIAGKNIADPTSLREAIFLACDIIKNRKEFTFWNSSPVKKIKLREEK
jgi:4-hydroxythreonine-4-phosphate dehydrogenase